MQFSTYFYQTKTYMLSISYCSVPNIKLKNANSTAFDYNGKIFILNALNYANLNLLLL